LSIDEKHIVIYEQFATKGKRVVVLINVKDFSVAGEYIINTKIRNEENLSIKLDESNSHNIQSPFSTSFFVPLITSNEGYLIIGKTNDD